MRTVLCALLAMLASLLTAREVLAKSEVVIHFDAPQSELPERLCVASPRIGEGSEPVVAGRSLPTPTAWCDARKAASKCDDRIESTYGHVCSSSWVVCSDGQPVGASAPNVRTAVLYVDGEVVPFLEKPILNPGGADATVSISVLDKVDARKYSFYVVAIGGSYAGGAGQRPILTRAQDLEVTIPLAARCVERGIPSTLIPNSIRVDGDEVTPGAIGVTLQVGAGYGNHKVQIQQVRRSTSGESDVVIEMVAEWRGHPPDDLPFAYTLLGVSWVRHGLYGDAACPSVSNVTAGIACAPSDAKAGDRAGVCGYRCTSSTPFRLPVMLHFEKPACDLSARRGCASAAWDDTLHANEEKLHGFVAPGARTLVIDASGWPALNSPNRARTIELHFSNGEQRELVFDQMGRRSWYVIDAPNIELGSTIRYDPRGERTFHEGQKTVDGEIVQLAHPAELTPALSTSLYAGALFAVSHNAFRNAEVPSEFAVAGDGMISWRPYDRRWALDWHLSYWLQTNRVYYPVAEPGAALRGERAFQNRAAALFGLSYYFSAWVALHAEGGLAVSWAVKTGDDYLIGGPMPAFYAAAGLRVRVLPVLWIEGNILGFAPEVFYRFDLAGADGTPSRISGESVSGGITFGIRIGNHTLQN